MTRVADLAGAELALWVARAIGVPAYIIGEVCRLGYDSETHNGRPVVRERYQPHEDCAVGGPLIDKYIIATSKGINQIMFPGWRAQVGEQAAYDNGMPECFGPTRLIAAMRALVASVYGDEVAT